MSDIKSSAKPVFLREDELRQGIELLFFAYRDFTAEPDAILRGPPDAILGVVMGFLEPGSKRGRKVTIEGDTAALDRLRVGRSPG